MSLIHSRVVIGIVLIKCFLYAEFHQVLTIYRINYYQPIVLIAQAPRECYCSGSIRSGVITTLKAVSNTSDKSSVIPTSFKVIFIAFDIGLAFVAAIELILEFRVPTSRTLYATKLFHMEISFGNLSSFGVTKKRFIRFNGWSFGDLVDIPRQKEEFVRVHVTDIHLGNYLIRDAIAETIGHIELSFIDLQQFGYVIYD